MGAVNIVMVGLDEDVPVRFPVAKELGATHCVNGSKEDVVKRCTEICGRDNLGLVVECSGANIALKQAIEMLRPNGEIVRVGMGFKPLSSLSMILHPGIRAHRNICIWILLAWRNVKSVFLNPDRSRYSH